jgi:ATP-binding cassette subfamily F protein 3
MNIDRLDPNNTIYEEIQNCVPDIHETEVRKTCANMMFSNNLSNKKINVLSGGEKSRVMLGKY